MLLHLETNPSILPHSWDKYPYHEILYVVGGGVNCIALLKIIPLTHSHRRDTAVLICFLIISA
jgi:hypothetical protein